MLELNINYNNMLNNIKTLLNEFLDKNSSIKSFVLGVSGGIDSALVATLVHMFVKDRVKLIGLSLPTMTNSLEEKERAEIINKVFCDEGKIIQIGTSTFDIITKLIPDLIDAQTMDENIRVGNIKARIRMIKLYDEARKNNGLVLSTDNFTEYLLGFWTIFGDEGDLGIIQQLFKTEVYGLSKYIVENTNLSPEQKKALSDCIIAKPTDGLGITDNDLEQLNPERKIGTYIDGYKEVDDILIKYLNGNIDLKDTLVIQRYNATHYKRNHPYIFIRENLIN